MKAIILFTDGTSRCLHDMKTVRPEKAEQEMNTIAESMKGYYGKEVSKIVLTKKLVGVPLDDVVCGEKRYAPHGDYKTMRTCVDEVQNSIPAIFERYNAGIINYHELAEALVKLGEKIETTGRYN